MLSKLKRLTTRLRKPNRLDAFSALASLLISVALSVGGALTRCDSSKIALLISFAIYFVPFFFLARALLRRLDKQKPKPEKKQTPRFCVKRFLLLFAIIIIPYLILFLAYYPGMFAYDVETQLMAGSMTNHHPIVHTLALHAFARFGHAAHLSDNSTIALMSLAQIFLCGAVYAYVAEYIGRITKRKNGIFAAIFFGWFPVCSFGAISITKDTTHALCNVLLLTKFHQTINRRTISRHSIIILGVIASLFCLSRNNAPFILALWLIPLFFILKRHTKRTAIVVTLLVALFCSFAIDKALNRAFNTRILSEDAAFSVPLQVIAGVVDRHPELMPEESSGERLLGFFEVGEGYEFWYNPINADSAKGSYGKQITKDNKIQLLLTSAGTAIRYPKDSLVTIMNLSKSSWYPYSYDYAYFYRGSFMETTFRPTSMLPNAKQSSKLPKLKEFLDRELKDMGYTSNAFLNLLLAPAIYVYALVFYIIYLCYSRRYCELHLGAFILAGYIITLIAAPGILIRYVSPVMICVPLLYVFTFCAKTSIIKPVTHTISVKKPAKRFKKPAKRKI
jgi:hypothetical protein